MQLIFGSIGYLFGYLLWFFYCLVKNYGVAIILFTIAIKIIMFPLSVKQQKTMAKNANLSRKQRELQKKYGNDKAKLNEELAKLYEKEGTNLFGCLSTFVPLFLMFSVYFAVVNPLQNTLHIGIDKINQALSTLQQIPVIGPSFTAQYGQITIVKHFNVFRDHLTMFNAADIANIDFFSQGFSFLGLNLLNTPSNSPFSSMLWIIPVLCFISYLITQIFTQKITGTQVQQQGCSKYASYVIPLISSYFAYNVPAAVGFYWVISTVFSFFQTLVLNHFYNAGLMNAKSEAARVLLRESEEKQMKPIQ